MTEPYFESGDVTLFHGDALEVARTLETGSVRTIVTSPPYFGLRDYGEDGQIGAEASVGEYVARMVELFRELRRVLADDGTLWLNLGDSYSSNGSGTQGESGDRASRTFTADGLRGRGGALPAKNLIGVPWRVAFALQDDGWILRSDIIWSKPNPMPESVTDRPTKAHEYLFLFAKNPRYYYDASAIAEPIRTDYLEQYERGKTRPVGQGRINDGRNDQARKTAAGFGTSGENRNKRTVWTVQPSRFEDAHFAVYPPELIRPCIRAGSAPGDTILDPFSGSGTTGAVATFEGRKYIGIDLNRDYLDLSLRTRFQQPTLAWEAS
jgi:site-specific DNA-methyltransferase (cytosine-N4-specific)